MKKSVLFIIIIFQFLLINIAYAQLNEVIPSLPTSDTAKDFTDDACDPLNPQEGQDCYQLLESIPLQDKVLDSIDTTASGGEEGIGGFLNFMFEIGIGIAGVLGVVMLVIYGFRYAANDKNINTFTRLKEKIGSVILGLLLLLGIFVILNTINPDLLIVEPEIGDVTLTINNLEGGDGIFLSGGGTAAISIPGALPGSGGRIDVTSIKNNLNQWDVLLSKYARQYNLDCTLLKAIMTQESKGVPNARSNTGAVGLMQIMPINWGSNSGQKMLEPETSINIGAKVFANFKKQPCLSSPKNGWYAFSGCSNQQVEYIIAAYNGGYYQNSTPTRCGNTMSKWQCGQGNSRETKDYVYKVIGYYNDLKSANMSCQ